MSFIYAERSEDQHSDWEDKQEGRGIKGREGWRGARREVLRDVNRMYRNQMELMGRTLQEAQRRFREEDIGNKQQRITFSETKSTNLYNLEDGFLESQLYDCSYEQAVADQEGIRNEIQNIKKMLGSRIKVSHEVDMERLPQQRSQVDWELLMDNRIKEEPLRELFKASLKKEEKSQAYIAYTEQSSVRGKTSQTVSIPTSSKPKGKKTAQAPTSDEKHRIYEDIHTRISNSPCTMPLATHSKQADKTLTLFTRLTREKQQRQSLLHRIKLKLK